MRKPPGTRLLPSLAQVAIGLFLLAVVQTSCSRKDAAPPNSPPAATANPTPAPAPIPVIATNAEVRTNIPAAPKGIAVVETVKAAKPVVISPPYHKVFVLCVGINLNPAYGNLKFAVSDAATVADTFRNIYGFTNVTLLTNAFATRSDVMAALDGIRGRLSPDLKDDFIFYFSGHGDTFSENLVEDGKTNVVRHGFLVAYDAKTNHPDTLPELQERNLEFTALASNIIQLPARHRLMIFDSCFSGLAFVNQQVVDKKADDFDPEVINHRTVQIMTAGLASEQALEDAKDAHGIFTAALLKQLTSENILTMEEIFFPLRVEVRNSLRQVSGSRKMTPQFRYLIYQNGSFLFVPLDQLSTWADTRSDNANIASAGAKGYLRPVTVAEATNVQSGATATPAAWDAEVDRYETRAAMGDPCASVALAQIYKDGIGVPPDPERAKTYTAESADYLTAANTFNIDIAGLTGINNAALQTIVGGLVKGFNANDLFQFRGSQLKGNNAAATGTQVALNEVQKPGGGAVGRLFTGIFSRSPIKDVASRQKKLKSLLAKPTDKNIVNAKKELISCEDDLVKLGEHWPPEKQPAELGQMKQLVKDTEIALDQNLTDQAKTSIEKLAAVIDSLQKAMKNASAGN